MMMKGNASPGATWKEKKPKELEGYTKPCIMFSSRLALVTGSTRGIGLAIAKVLTEFKLSSSATITVQLFVT